MFYLLFRLLSFALCYQLLKRHSTSRVLVHLCQCKTFVRPRLIIVLYFAYFDRFDIFLLSDGQTYASGVTPLRRHHHAGRGAYQQSRQTPGRHSARTSHAQAHGGAYKFHFAGVTLFLFTDFKFLRCVNGLRENQFGLCRRCLHAIVYK